MNYFVTTVLVGALYWGGSYLICVRIGIAEFSAMLSVVGPICSHISLQDGSMCGDT